MILIHRREILSKVGALNVWRQGDTRAPHKPLLVLLALSRLLRGEERRLRFADIEEKLAQLIQTFGPPRSQVHPEYPFWWLQTDGLWVLSNPELLARRRFQRQSDANGDAAVGHRGISRRC